jgi:hypothetical protein
MKNIIKVLVFSILCFAFISCGNKGYHKKENYIYDIESAEKEIEIIEENLDDIISYIKKSPKLFLKSKNGDKILTRSERLEIWQVWGSFAHFISRLDYIGAKYDYFYKTLKFSQKEKSFATSYYIFLTKYKK